MKFAIKTDAGPQLIETEDWTAAQDTNKGIQCLVIKGKPFLLDAVSFEMIYTLSAFKAILPSWIIKIEGNHAEVWRM